MSTTNLVPIACKFARTHQAELFRVACLYKHKNWTTRQMQQEYKKQTACEVWEEWVQDTALDILAGRIPLWIKVAEEGEVYIVRPINHLLPNELWKAGELETWDDGW